MSLNTFLGEHRATKDDKTGVSNFTHTSVGNPKGSYYIPPELRTKLHSAIIRSVYEKNLPVHLTEKPLENKIITIDIDLRYSQEHSTRMHNEKHIRALVGLYNDAIHKYIDLPSGHKLQAYVFERDSSYAYRGDFKDGIHIIYPHVLTHVTVQHLIRQYVLKRAAEVFDNKELGVLPYKNPKGLTDVIDHAVIEKNNWTLFGCTKPGYNRYELTYLFEQQSNGLIELEGVRKNYRPLELINLLSIHESAEKLTPFLIREELKGEVEDFTNKKITKKINRTYDTTRQITKRHVNNEYGCGGDETRKSIDEAQKLVALLAQWRSDDRDSWLETGMCLFNISDGLLETWIEFSKRSPKFEEGECENHWSKFEPRTMGMGSLHRWASLDNPAEYKQARHNFISNHIHRSVSGTTQDVATVVYTLYKYQYVCKDAKGSKWMEFKKHRWYPCDGGITLKSKIGNEVLNEYLRLVTHYNVTAINHENDKKEQYLHRAKALTEITYKLRDVTFKEKVMKECVIMFYNPLFANKLDEDADLIGFENGIYDLKEGCFRHGRPEDYVSLSTGHDFVDYPDIDVEDSEEPIVAEINDFIAQVFPSASVRRYVWKMLASFIQGHNPDERFHIWNGVGGNGKSKLLELFECAFGAYCFKLPVASVTQKRGSASGAQPELARTRGLRFGSVQEPDEGVRINMGVVKEYTGGDKIFARALYSDGGEFKPQFKLAFLTNFLPKVPSNDEGTWRRLVVLFFGMRFVNEPKAANERKKDGDLSKKIPRWGATFMYMLTQWFKIYKNEGLKLPEEIETATYEYRKESDAYSQFKDEFFVADEDGLVRLDESYGVFQDWYAKEYNEKAPPRRDFKPNIERKLGVKYGRGNKAGWYGWSMRCENDEIMDKLPAVLDDIPPVPQKAKISIISAKKPTEVIC